MPIVLADEEGIIKFLSVIGWDILGFDLGAPNLGWYGNCKNMVGLVGWASIKESSWYMSSGGAW